MCPKCDSYNVDYLTRVIGYLKRVSNFSNCPFRCEGCHSPELQEDLGEGFTAEKLIELIDRNQGITCVYFMGGDRSLADLKTLSRVVSERSIKYA